MIRSNLHRPEYPRSLIEGGKNFFTVVAYNHRSILTDTQARKLDRSTWILYFMYYNLVKHGLVQTVPNWPWSSFPHYIITGYYESNWEEAVGQEVEGVVCVDNNKNSASPTHLRLM